jgi:hypothetical protein
LDKIPESYGERRIGEKANPPTDHLEGGEGSGLVTVFVEGVLGDSIIGSTKERAAWAARRRSTCGVSWLRSEALDNAAATKGEVAGVDAPP